MGWMSRASRISAVFLVVPRAATSLQKRIAAIAGGSHIGADIESTAGEVSEGGDGAAHAGGPGVVEAHVR
jgi:hypothetical protein